MYDQVYSHLIGTSQHQYTIVRVLGQWIISEDMNRDADTVSTYENSSSPNQIEIILGLEHGTILRLLANMHLPLEIGHGDQDIKICDPFFRIFLLDQSRSQGLFFDLDDARLTLKYAAPIRKLFGEEGELNPLKMLLRIDDLNLISFLNCVPWAADALARELFIAASRYVRPSILVYEWRLEAFCATLRVRTFRSFTLPWTPLICIQKSGFPGSGESDVDTRPQLF